MKVTVEWADLKTLLDAAEEASHFVECNCSTTGCESDCTHSKLERGGDAVWEQVQKQIMPSVHQDKA